MTAAPSAARVLEPRAAPSSDRGVAVAAALLTLALLVPVQLFSRNPALIAERFVPHAGWAQIAVLTVYAGWIALRLLDLKEVALWRRRLWLLFSIVFFGQLLLGLAGIERFLMTGELHLPIPAMIVAGPVYRGEGLFMPILLAATLLVVGPAWCSYLCYIGAWDLWASRARKRPRPLPRWRGLVRVGLLVGVAAVALVLRLSGVAGAVAAGAGAAFGFAGVAVMLGLSRRTGAMVHCTSYCPIGVIATVGGKLSPFRMRITSACIDCAACSVVCRYDALRPEDIARRRPGLSCTLCGECLRTCKGRFIVYRFPGLSPEGARKAFFATIAGLHAAFIGVAMI